ncbi:unnamed protein product, partial [Mesorhabditis spiculigera]
MGMNTQIKCYDPLPFAITGFPIDYSKCTKVWPISDWYDAILYACEYAAKSLELQIRFVDTGLFQEFAVSVRVREWANSQYDVILFPQSIADPWPAKPHQPVVAFLLPALHIWTVVLIAPDNLTNKTYPDITVDAFFYKEFDENGLSDAYRIPLYVGPDPGMSTKNLIVSNRDFLQHLHCSVATLMGQYEGLDIYLTIYFNSREKPEVVEESFKDVIITSPKYPWIFDESDDVTFTSLAEVNSYYDNVPMDVVLTAIEGGTVLLKTASQLENFTKILTAADLGQRLQLTAKDLNATFHPDPEYKGPHGFVLTVESPAHRIERNSCVRNITLTNENPFFSINQIQFDSGRLLCIKLGEDAVAENLMVLTFCDTKSKANHGKEDRIEGCSYYNLDLIYSMQTCCQMTLNISRSEYTQISMEREYSSLLIQLPSAISKSKNYFAVGISPYALDYRTMAFSNFAEKDTLLFIVLCYDFNNLWGLLGQLQWTTTRQCKGMAMDLGRGFGDPFHDQIYKTNSTKTWECETFIDVTYELKALNMGSLSVAALDAESQVLDRMFFESDNLPQLPTNITFIGARKLQVSWIGGRVADIREATGYLGTIHFQTSPWWTTPAPRETSPRSARSSHSSLNETAIKCYDALPFTVSKVIVDFQGCTEAWPIGKKYDSAMYGCAYAVKSRTIEMTYMETGLLQEFAISIRVLEWANSQYGLILFPQSVTDPYPASRQNRPITFRLPPLHVFTVVLIAPEKLTNRTYPDVTLESLFSYQVPSDAYRIPLFVGSDPGMSTNTLHSSLVVSPRQHLHCSAVTIISQYEEWAISLDLFFNWQERLEPLSAKFREQVLTSPKYPWIFDEVEDVDFASVTGIEMSGGYASMDLELMSIEGGTLYLEMACRAGNKTKILTSKDLGYEFQITAHVVSARFQPDANYTGPRGFLLSVKSIERQIELNSCVRNITLTKADPVFAINQIQYQTGQYVCVKLDETNEKQQQLVATYCNLKSKNNHVKEHRIDDCIYYDVDLVYLTQTCCRMTMNTTRIDYTKIRIDIEYSSLLIQLSDSILEDVDYLPIGIQPFSSNFQTMSLSANAEKDTLVFLIFCYSYTNWGVLEQLRRAHSDQDCEYSLYAGAIPNGDDKLPLATYHESEQFYPQFLPSGVYSSYIPKGCNPTIAVSVIQLNADPGPLIVDSTQCKGIAMDVGHGFGDRLHEFNVDVNSTKIWECESRIDIEYQLKALNMGSLEILALDADSQILARECFEADNLPELPKNTTFRGVYKLKTDNNRFTNVDDEP